MRTRFFAFPVAVAFLLTATTARSQERNLPPVTVTASSNVTKAVATSFNNTFPDALETQWLKVNRNYLAQFMADDQKNSALFRKNGSLIYHITYGYEKDLPADVRTIVRTHYPDFSISQAISVSEADRKIWVITVQDMKKIILVRIEDGESEEVGNYNKTK